MVVRAETLPERVSDRGERLARPLDLMQLLGGQRERLQVGTQRLQVDRRPGHILCPSTVGGGVLVREQEFGHRCLLVPGDVVRPAPHGGGQLPPHHRAGEDRPVVAQRDAGYLPLPQLRGRGSGWGGLAGVGRWLGVRAGFCGGRAPDGFEVGPPGGVEAVAGLFAAWSLRLADVQTVGVDRGGHDLVVQVGVAAVAAQDEGEVTAGFGEQVPAVEPAATVHHEHRRGDVDRRQGDVHHRGDPGPDGDGRSASALEERVHQVGTEVQDGARLPRGAQLRERPGLLLGGGGS
ncbi:hypothetical protein [Streptomyces chrestomyceticus]|uniref:Uncharacterized protein n=1 Tax=Streptomyces chrestomyceticus TaxID=68185 RepID=A0ABU7X1K4_9ACTN